MTSTRRALVVIDVQQEYFEGPLMIEYPPREVSLANIVRVMDSAAAHDIPVVLIRHESRRRRTGFRSGSSGAQLHPQVAERVRPTWKETTKQVASALDDTSVVDWLRDRDIETITLVGYMTNNCVIGTAAGAEPLGFAVEVLSDATGAIHLTNSTGSIPAEQVHQTLMTLLNSNFAAVATTEHWLAAVEQDEVLAGSNLVSSATDGRTAHG